MKKIMFMAMMMTIAISAQAMPYNTARNEALFLSDKMAYELNLTDAQYEAVYEINLDYFLNINTQNDLFGPWWNVRNRDLQMVLGQWQYDRYIGSHYFYRPLAWRAGAWNLVVYNRYNRGLMYHRHPVAYQNFRGGHSHRGTSFYHRHHFATPATPPRGHTPSARPNHNHHPGAPGRPGHAPGRSHGGHGGHGGRR